jgi:phosphoglucosamine mutase
MTPAFAWRAGRAAGEYFSGTRGATVVVGRDTRGHGRILEEALVAGLVAGGLQVERAGVLPTAAVALLARRLGAAAGIMVSASHNPAGDNGIKFFAGSGFKLADADELELERLMESGRVPDLPEGAPARQPQDFQGRPEYASLYRECLLASLPAGFSLGGLKIVVDAAHGAAWQTTPSLLRALGAEVEVLGDAPDGTNINCNLGSEHPEALLARLSSKQGGEWLGLAHDGDADRVLLVDEAGQPMDGDECLAIAATHALKEDRLAARTVVATVMSNLGLEECLRARGARLERSQVGDRYVVEKMLETGATLGGEQSGHLVFLEHLTGGDGLLAALQLLRVRRETGSRFRELRTAMRRYPQVLLNVKVARKKPLGELSRSARAVADLEAAFGEEGRVLVRYSGTENKLRLLLEHRSREDLRACAEALARVFQEELAQ